MPKGIIEWALLCFLLFVLIYPAMACDCTFTAIDHLRNAGVRLKTVPAVIVNHDQPRGYKDGVINIHRTEDCKVMTHELAHHAQHERYGAAVDWADWERRERDADALTDYAHKGNCM